jgi:NAD(P)-dependent dehydrogenase (short-subunit alcohol dehydrogenase family)
MDTRVKPAYDTICFAPEFASMTAPPLASRIALVTGASRGIGYAVARALAKAGAHVVAVARTQAGLEELDDEIRSDGGTATLVPLNLTDFDGIARLGAALHERHGKLDILVGNAGVAGPSSPLGHIELKPWNDVMAINATANFQLIRCMEPLLKKSDAGRAVFVTSAAASKANAYLGPYAASKAALETLARSWAEETANTLIRVNLFDPGPIRTRMRASVFPGEDPMTLDTPEQVAEFIVPMCGPDWNETGKLFQYKTRSLLSFRAPA